MKGSVSIVHALLSLTWVYMVPISIARVILEQLSGVALPDWPVAAAALQTKRLLPGQYLFRTGDMARSVFFVTEGLIKMVYETRDGQEWIKAFAGKSMFFASLSALQPKGVASFSALALGHTVVEQMDYQTIVSLADRHIEWQRVLARAFEIYGSRKEIRERALLTQSPEERYRSFLVEYPDIAAQISQKDLAGYIRITPVALSRIKARMKRAGRGIPA